MIRHTAAAAAGVKGLEAGDLLMGPQLEVNETPEEELLDTFLGIEPAGPRSEGG